ncbi:unnamed protein product [Sphenostylis stenocarpa]|uniref:Disease resistance protein RPS4B/Roq1-like leucine-rich repeats domain-containing protein n=1 Tax=Sphenostylis stenocarpa TaxID=92480 RepID=A0AA86SD18_9FABA|nr:unnamed protein product [Sphenostylis stenocarpa]
MQKFVYLRVLNFDECRYLTHLPDSIAGLSNLEELSFLGCFNLIAVHDSINFLVKLKTVKASGCIRLKSFPPLKLPSLEHLGLSHCHSLENFPEILGKMENMTKLTLYNTPVKRFPVSFQNLIGLQELNLRLNGMGIGVVRLPTSIIQMPELTAISGEGLQGWQWLQEEEGTENFGSLVSSKVEDLSANYCNLNDDFFSIDFTWFAHLKKLNLRYNNFSIIPECINKCQFLWMLDVSHCRHLREIKGVPPTLKEFFAIACESLTSSSIDMFLNQELHEGGYTSFNLPGARIPEWLDQRSRGPSISFWFRNNFPDKVLCFVIAPMLNYDKYFCPSVFINGNKFTSEIPNFSKGTDHTYLSDLRLRNFTCSPYDFSFENEWNHVEIKYLVVGCKETSLQIGIHIFNQETSMEDVRFTDPYSTRGK